MSKKILIVDDDLFIRDLYEEVLKNEGFDVTIATDGQEGLNHLQEGGFDLTLLDIMMPKLDGISVLKQLKTSPAKKANGPIILLTNLAQDKVVQEGIGYGATSYLVKADLTPEDFLNKIKALLK